MLVRASSPGSTWEKLAKGGGWQGLAFSLLSNIQIRPANFFSTPPLRKSRRTVAKEGRKNPRKTHETLAALRLQPFHPSDKEKPKSDRRTVRFSPKNRGSFVQQRELCEPFTGQSRGLRPQFPRTGLEAAAQSGMHRETDCPHESTSVLAASADHGLNQCAPRSDDAPGFPENHPLSQTPISSSSSLLFTPHSSLPICSLVSRLIFDRRATAGYPEH
jgi:hypothetical protein